MKAMYIKLLFFLTIVILTTSCFGISSDYYVYEDQSLKFSYPKTMEITSNRPDSTVTLFSDKQNQRELTYFHGALSGGMAHEAIALTSLMVFFFDVTSDAEMRAARATQSDLTISGFPAIEFHGYMDDYFFGRSYFRYVDIFTSDTKYGFKMVRGIENQTEEDTKRIQKEMDDVWEAFIKSIKIK